MPACLPACLACHGYHTLHPPLPFVPVAFFVSAPALPHASAGFPSPAAAPAPQPPWHGRQASDVLPQARPGGSGASEAEARWVCGSITCQRASAITLLPLIAPSHHEQAAGPASASQPPSLAQPFVPRVHRCLQRGRGGAWALCSLWGMTTTRPSLVRHARCGPQRSRVQNLALAECASAACVPY